MIIACDFFLDLRLYKLPESFDLELKEKFPDVSIVDYNTPKSKVIDPESIDIYWGNRINKSIINELSNLKWIHLGSVGYNQDIIEKSIKRKIIISNSSGITTNAVVASGLGFIFSLARGFHRSWNIRFTNKFNRKAFDKHFDQIQDVFGQSVLVAGFGDIGKKLAESCNSLGLKVSIIRKNIQNKPDWVENVFSLKEIHKAVSEVDYVINALPLTKETKNIFTMKIFSKMKKQSFFINIGRGDTVVESELIESLKSKTIAGAGIDVFSSNSYVDPYTPLNSKSELFNLDNVILTPHISGITRKYWNKQSLLFLDNLQRFINNESLINIVN